MKEVKTNICVEISLEEDLEKTYSIYAVNKDLKMLMKLLNELKNNQEAHLVKSINLSNDSLKLIIKRDDSIDNLELEDEILRIRMEVLENDSGINLIGSKNSFKKLNSILKEGLSIAPREMNLPFGIIFSKVGVSFIEPQFLKMFEWSEYISTIK